jgi:hypothetical protein
MTTASAQQAGRTSAIAFCLAAVIAALGLVTLEEAAATPAQIHTLPMFGSYSIGYGFGEYLGHEGTDYFVGAYSSGGEVVVAASRGTAIDCYQSGIGAGNFVVMDHENGQRTRYLHLSSDIIDDGDTIARGEVIGYEGNVGVADGSNHLHFETRHTATAFNCNKNSTSGTAVDPYDANNYMWEDQPPGGQPPNHADFSPAVATWTSSRVDVFVRGKDNDLWRRTRISGSWGSWSRPRPGDCLRSAPGASTWGASGVDVFYRGCDNDLFQVTWNGSQWLEVRPMPGSCLLGAPAAASWGSSRIDVFYRGCDNDLFQATWNGSQWSVIRPMPGSCLRSGPGAVSPPGTTRLEIAYRGCDDGIWRYGYASGAWTGGGLGGCTMVAPAVTSYTSSRIDIFSRGCGPADTGEGVFQNSYTGSWSGWVNRNGCLASGPGGDAGAPNLLDVLYRGCGSPPNAYDLFWNGGAWAHALFTAWP